MGKVDFDGSLQEFFQMLRTDPQFYFTRPEDLLQGYRDILAVIEENLPTQFGNIPSLPYEVVPVPEYSQGSAVAAYYLQGSPETGRPGQFFANTYNLSGKPKWEMESLALHEALPGHHMQISLTMEMDNLPDFRKLSFFTAYIEG